MPSLPPGTEFGLRITPMGRLHTARCPSSQQAPLTGAFPAENRPPGSARTAAFIRVQFILGLFFCQWTAASVSG